MNWLFEANPYLVTFCGGAVVLLLLVAMFNTGRKRYLALALGAVLLTGLVLLVEWAMVTPREEIENTLQTIAAELERNDDAAVLGHISASRPDLRVRAQTALALGNLHDVKIARNLEIDVEPERGVAEATFNARVRGSVGGFENQTQVIGFRVFFRREEDGQWRIREYEADRPEL